MRGLQILARPMIERELILQAPGASRVARERESMSALVCALSGEVPSEPVVSIKSGHLFEKKLITKYVEVAPRPWPAAVRARSLLARAPCACPRRRA